MKLWKKILLAIASVLVLSQVPGVFNLYRTYRQNSLIEDSSSDRKPEGIEGYKDYKGVLHVHTRIGGHSYGRFDEVISAAKSNELDFVVMTEHIAADKDTFGKSIQGNRDGVLFLGGNEVGIGENRFLVVEGFRDVLKAAELPVDEFLETARTPERLALVAHPERGKQDIEADGIEVFSLHTGAKEFNKVFFALDALWGFGPYPGLSSIRHFKRPDESLQLYDRISNRRKVTMFAGTDVHSGLGFQVGGTTDEPAFEMILDRYASMFEIVRTHVVVREDSELTRETLINALRSGNGFIGLDILGQTGGFRFEAKNSSGRAILGDEMAFEKGTRLVSSAPQEARFVVYRNGTVFFEKANSRSIDIEITENGVYRVEVYRDALGSPFNELPWILSNPVYLR